MAPAAAACRLQTKLLPLPLMSSENGDDQLADIEQDDLELEDELHEILQDVPSDFFTEHGFNPFVHWKEDPQYLDQLNLDMESAVHKIAERKFKGFNQSISSFIAILKQFTGAQQTFGKLQQQLGDTRRLLTGGALQQNLRSLYFESMMHTTILATLDKIDYLLSVPKQLDNFLRRRQYLHAVSLLSASIESLVDPELQGIEGLRELYEDLCVRKDAVKEVLIDKLHLLIYTAQAPSQADSTGALGSSKRANSELSDDEGSGAASGSGARRHSVSLRGGSSTVDRTTSIRATLAAPVEAFDIPVFPPFLNIYDESRSAGKRSDIQALMMEELKPEYVRSPEDQPDTYLRILVEALDRIHYIPSAESALHKRLRSEIRHVIDTQTAQFRAHVEATHAQRFQSRGIASGDISDDEADAPKNAQSSEPKSEDSSALPLISALGVRSVSGELLVELLERVFAALTRVLRNHLNAMQLIQLKLSDGHQAQLLYRADAVWNAMQAEVEESLGDYIQAVKKKALPVVNDKKGLLPNALTSLFSSATNDNHDDLPTPAQAAAEFVFSFEDSAAPSAVLQARGGGAVPKSTLHANLKTEGSETPSNNSFVATEAEQVEDNGRQALRILPSPYNIVVIYRRVVQFTDQCISMIGVCHSVNPTAPDAVAGLRVFMNDFVKNTLMPRVQADAHVRVKEMLFGPAAFKPKDSAHNLSSEVEVGSAEADNTDEAQQTKGIPLLRAAIDVVDLCRRVFADMFQLPFVPEFVSVVEYVLSRFLECCHEKFDENTRKTYVASRLGNAADGQLARALFADPLYRSMRGLPLSTTGTTPQAATEPETVTHALMDAYFAEHERHVFSALLQGKQNVERSQLIFDPQRWSLLAMLTESIEWVCESVRQMADPSANPSTATESVDLSKTSNAQRQHRSASVSVRAFAGSQPNSAASRRIAAVFGPSQDFMLDSFQQLADQCLFAMRLEIAVHCLFFLQAMRDENYWLTDEPTTPEPFVLELNTSLTQAEERLSVCLPSDKIKYLFGTTAQMMGAIFVAALPAVVGGRVNRHGVEQVLRNLSALQQNLTNIVVTPETYFDRARQFAELLLLNEEALLARLVDIKQQESHGVPAPFSSADVRALFVLQTPTRRASTANA